ncbi:hypothetical protein [Mycobacterium sp. JS623]|uniref:hypothetical protein n=1 Tax=Mycobacterium sp. JS623 TaxID=212767 RepID=UPI0012FB4B8B|nr:hypothetical protein [Mycobacterium sp. JS623]
MQIPRRKQDSGRPLPPDSSPRLTTVLETKAQVRPSHIGPTYLELEFDARRDEQTDLFRATGVKAARSSAVDAKGREFGADQARTVATNDMAVVEKACAEYQQARELLSRYTHRKSTSSIGYMARTGGLLFGDVAGLGTAAVALGELPALACVQAVAAGTATITAGLVGTHLRHRHDATERQRQLEHLPKDLESYRHLFLGITNSGISAAIFAIAASIMALIALGVGTLRMSVEGIASGITFGALAAAIAMASFVNSWHHADLVADIVENADRTYRRAIKRHQKLAEAATIRNQARSSEEASSITTEHVQRGTAASWRVEALKQQALLANPDVVGHGLPASIRSTRMPPTNGQKPEDVKVTARSPRRNGTGR